MKTFLLALCCLTASVAAAQPTLGLLQHNAGSQDDGYVLFAPIYSTTTYLMDKCGRQVHTWSSAYKPAVAVYLLPDGQLLRTGNANNTFMPAGGQGGIIEMLDWNSNVIWRYRMSDSTQCLHHDVKMLPNGNVLAIAWEYKSAAEATMAGRDPNLLGTSIWSEKVVELQPIGADSAAIVWEWHLWDHLVQDYDQTMPNYGTVAAHPELLNLNFTYGARTNPDWIHLNSIDYNPALDQIMLSSHSLSEIWIIDHSTTTAEAASHSGGRSGKGGDLLYRWGNPAAYGQGTPADQQLYAQHNATWLKAGMPYAGQIMVFNNGWDRPAPAPYSSVEIINPPLNLAGQYASALPYAPAAPTRTYTAANPSDFYAQFLSGAEFLPNGNLLMCNGPAGHFIETAPNGQVVWEYINPVTDAGPLAQGDPPAHNWVFRALFIKDSYSGLAGQSLQPGQPLELNPLPASCTLFTGTGEQEAEEPLLTVWPNPAAEALRLQTAAPEFSVELFSAQGRLVFRGRNVREIDVSRFSPGLYLLCCKTARGEVAQQKVVIAK